MFYNYSIMTVRRELTLDDFIGSNPKTSKFIGYLSIKRSNLDTKNPR